jgi:hypothetical protein
MQIDYKSRKLEKAFLKKAQAVKEWGGQNARSCSRGIGTASGEQSEILAHCLGRGSTP